VLSREEELNDKPSWSLDSLPPPINEVDKTIKCSPIPQMKTFPLWARQLLSDWGEVSEVEALRRTNLSRARSVESKPSYQLSEKGSKDTKLSPYLRFGMVSPQRAAMAGVRKRDLLWRDWSRVCFGLLNPLRTGKPVLEYMDKCNQFNNTDVKDGELLNMWIVGKTGSQIVDAGMRQLWLEGWMPRKVRLLSAGCLVEGMGLDWRLGRDWFKHTLIDHDPAINELMWQNAGLVGVDPFYNGIAWEAAPSDEDTEYIEKWMNAKLNWPSYLKTYATRQPLKNVVQTAKSRRNALQLKGVYKAARTVSNSGVRVAWPGLVQQDNSIAPGEVLGIGLKPINELSI
jgi:deoxyribodipyrimidine photolyase